MRAPRLKCDDYLAIAFSQAIFRGYTSSDGQTQQPNLNLTVCEIACDSAFLDIESLYAGSGVEMTRIEEIESQIKKLNPDELSVFRRWFLEFDADSWDRQIEADARNGKLDFFADSALEDHKNGRSTVL